MTLKKESDIELEAAPSLPVTPLVAAVPAPTSGAPCFRDKQFTSRTLTPPNGQAYAVAQGRIQAVDAELLAYLKQHPDFEPVSL